jgi:hypothetical protein
MTVTRLRYLAKINLDIIITLRVIQYNLKTDAILFTSF